MAKKLSTREKQFIIETLGSNALAHYRHWENVLEAWGLDEFEMSFRLNDDEDAIERHEYCIKEIIGQNNGLRGVELFDYHESCIFEEELPSFEVDEADIENLKELIADIYTNYFDELIQHHQDEIKRIREEITETVKEVDEERSDIQCCCPDDEDNCIHINYELYRGRKLIGEYGECTDCGSAAGWAGEAGWDFGKDAEKIWNDYYKPLLKD